MDNSMLVALQSQRILQRRMEIAANNLANMNTTGFKADALVSEEIARRPAQAQDQPQDIHFARDITVARDMRAGAVTVTANALDFALDGEGFFMVQGPNGPLYTRDGAFSLTGDGRLVTSDGRAVLSQGGSAIVFDAQGQSPTVTPDGAITVNGQSVGQIGVATFARPGALERAGDNLLDARGQTPGGFEGRVIQGALEGSNVEPVLELTRLIQISRAYESAARFVNQTDELRQRSLERLGR